MTPALVIDAPEAAPSVPQLLEGLARRGVAAKPVDGALVLDGAEVLAPDERAALAARQGEVLAYLLARQAAAARVFSPIAGAEPGAALIQDMWWGWVRSAEPQLPHEKLCVIVPLTDADAGVVERAIRALVGRHATLRARFAQQGERLAVTLSDAETFEVQTVALPEDEATPVALETQRPGLLKLPIRIQDEALGCGRVFTQGGAVVGAALVFHHMVLDARSLVLLDKELRQIVEAGGDAAALPPAAQYTDYGPWERAWLAREGGPLLSYWREWLQSVPPLTTPRGRPLRWAPGEKRYFEWALAGGAVERLRRLTAANGCTMFTAVLAAVGIAAGEWSGCDRFALRVIGDLRTTRTLASMVGNLVCTDLVDMRALGLRDPAGLLRETASAYTAATRLRLPNLLGLPDSPTFPDVRPGGVGDKTGLTLNYLPIYAIRGPAPDAEEQAPIVNAMAQTEHWPTPMCAINLRVWDYGVRLYAKLEFNADLIAEDEQRRFGQLFSEALVALSAGVLVA